VAPELSPEFLQQVRARAGRFRRRAVDAPDLVPAAVAVVLLPNRLGRPSFLLTRRTASLQRHAGQWALPGGRRDPGESATVTAVRELWEELGVPSSRLEEVGLLDDYVTRSGYAITPVVLVASSIARLRPNPAEVAAAYRIPIQTLTLPGMPIIGEQDGAVTLRLRILGRYVHPPTAAILHQLAELVVHGRETRVNHYAQPRFTWR
jgi:8-oxo-dGTP pyrophosphatase MutT (NUDIX family)